VFADARAATALASASSAVVLADARAATAHALAFDAIVLADARAATALAFASFAVVLADARAATLSAYALFAIVGAFLADPRHLQTSLCFLLLLDETSEHSLLLRQDKPALLASPSSLKEIPLLSPKAGESWLLWAERRKRGSGVSVKPDGEATSACRLSRGIEAQASPSSLTEKQRVLMG
jgi:hypothetical protein